VFGAFTVGVLCGWTDSGKRPQFDVVTGISTGALIATYAFLGPKYDSILRDYYSNYGSRDVYRPRRKLSILWSDSVVDNSPLRQKIDAACTPELLAEVAEAHRAGRRLYIGTTNLDTRQLVIWDMGAIAASGRPEARALYRDVILASSSVPAFFPPVRIDVEINGQRYQELHVDGGATTAVFFQPFMLNLDPGNIRSRAGSNLYVINAGKIFADPDCVQPRIIKIAGTTLRSMIYAGTRNDLFRIYTLALIAGLNYHLAALPQDFPMDLDALKIDPKQMRRLYEEGYRQGLTGTAWHTRPDNIGLSEDIMPRSGTRLQAWPMRTLSR
jgi:predicted acylesterase/phospholipase RssA